MTLVEFLTARLREDEYAILGDISRPGLPYRACRDIAAKRAIMAEHAIVDPGEEWQHCRGCEERWLHDAMRAPCPTLRILAWVYSDHPDYDPEWALDRALREVAEKLSTLREG